jgi:hypothetical protein
MSLTPIAMIAATKADTNISTTILAQLKMGVYTVRGLAPEEFVARIVTLVARDARRLKATLESRTGGDGSRGSTVSVARRRRP